MSDTNPKAEVVDIDHPVHKAANALAGTLEEIAVLNGMSPWQLLLAYANATGIVLAAQEDIPRDKALERMDGLRQCMQAAYDLYDVEGEG